MLKLFLLSQTFAKFVNKMKQTSLDFLVNMDMNAKLAEISLIEAQISIKFVQFATKRPLIYW